MPCSTCGELLLANHEKRKMICPYCINLEIEDQEVVEEKAKQGLELFRDENLVSILEDYSKGNLLLYLIERLNIISFDFIETRRLDFRGFSYLNYLIQIIYPEDGFGEEQLDRGEELDEVIDVMLDAQAQLITSLNHADEQFVYCYHRPVLREDPQPFFGEYDLYDSEYRWGYYRCLRSLIGGREEDVDLFDDVYEKLRDFERPEGDLMDSLENFAKIAYEFIASMIFVASADDVVGQTYTTFLPDSVSVIDIDDFLNGLDERFDDSEGNSMIEGSTLAWAPEPEVDKFGEEVFGDEWDEVKDKVIVGRDNLDAHPILFQLDVERVVKEVPGRPLLTVPDTRIVYPRYYAKILRYQLFPLLQNGDDPTGHEILTNQTEPRGLEYERMVYEYLDNLGIECYHSALIVGSDREEIDVLVVDDEKEELWFIECKYLLPEIKMNSAEGIEKMDGKFDYKVFKEPGAYPTPPSGDPFPEKVERWSELRGGDVFSWQEGPNETDRIEQEFQSEWLNFRFRMFVVSNLVPTYLEKDGVRFLTDMEFIEYLRGDAELYTIRH